MPSGAGGWSSPPRWQGVRAISTLGSTMSPNCGASVSRRYAPVRRQRACDPVQPGRPVYRSPKAASGREPSLLRPAVVNGRDHPPLPVIERKRTLRPTGATSLKLVEEALCVPGRGRKLFEVVQQHDLEGLVAKRKANSCEPRSHWIKIKNAGWPRRTVQPVRDVACVAT
jgi:hypothetical protein